MPSWTELRQMDVGLKKPEARTAPDLLADPLADPLSDPLVAKRKEAQAKELASLGSGRGLAAPRSDGSVMGDMRDMTADPVFGYGESRFAGLAREEDYADADAKRSRQEEWERQKAELGGVSPAQKAVHKLDKVTGGFGADVAKRYATKAKRGLDSSSALRTLGTGAKGKGGADFFGKGGVTKGAKRWGERIGRRVVGTAISTTAKLSGEAPIVGPALGAARDGMLAKYEHDRATSAGEIADRDGVDDLTASLALGSKKRHEQRRDESALKGTTRGALGFIPLPFVASTGASTASTLKSGMEHLRSGARKTRLAAATGDDDALLRLPQEDNSYRGAMLDYLEVGSSGDDGEERSSRGLAKLGSSENALAGRVPYAAAPTAARIDIEPSHSVSDSDSGRFDVADPTPDDLGYDDVDESHAASVHDAHRSTLMSTAEQRDHMTRHGAMLDDLTTSTKTIGGRQDRLTGQLDDGKDHTLRPSLTAKRSAGEVARKRQKERMGSTLKELRDLDSSAWYDSRTHA